MGCDNERGAVYEHTRVSRPLLAAGVVERTILPLRKVCSAGPGEETDALPKHSDRGRKGGP